MKYAVSEMGIEQLNKLSQDLNNCVSQLIQSVKGMNSEISGNVQGAGPHFGEIQEMTAEVAAVINKIQEPIEEIVETLEDLAEEYQDIIDRKIAAAGSASGAAGGFVSGTSASAGSGSGSGNSVSSSGSANNRAGNAASSAGGITFDTGGSWSTITNGLLGNLPEGYSFMEGNPQHRQNIKSHAGQIAAVTMDVLKGSGKIISPVQAEKLLRGLRGFTGTQYGQIRKAYQDGAVSGDAKDNLDAVDSYVHAAPKYQGTVMRGVHVSEETARKWLTSKEPFTMLGPSSWSTDPQKAVDFAMDPGFSGAKAEPIKVVFVLTDNKSGSSVTHVSSYGDVESEVLAPSDSMYICDGYTITGGGGLIVYVHEADRNEIKR